MDQGARNLQFPKVASPPINTTEYSTTALLVSFALLGSSFGRALVLWRSGCAWMLHFRLWRALVLCYWFNRRC